MIPFFGSRVRDGFYVLDDGSIAVEPPGWRVFWLAKVRLTEAVFYAACAATAGLSGKERGRVLSTLVDAASGVVADGPPKKGDMTRRNGALRFCRHVRDGRVAAARQADHQPEQHDIPWVGIELRAELI